MFKALAVASTLALTNAIHIGNYQEPSTAGLAPSDTTGPAPSDTTGPAPSDTTGPAPSDTTGPSEHDGPHCRPNFGRIAALFMERFDHDNNHKLDREEQREVLQFFDKFIFDLPQSLFDDLPEHRTFGDVADGLKEMAEKLPPNFDKLTRLILHPEGFNHHDEDHETLNKREFSEATSFLFNVICSFDDQVFEALDFNHSGFIEAPEIAFGLQMLFA